jgi:glycosyltransferase involved in cell wall biosynthesis
MSQLSEKPEQGELSPFRGLKVCMVAPYLPRKGGVTIQAHLMVDGLEREGAEVVRVDTILHSISHPFLLPLRIPLQAIFTAVRFLRSAPKCDIVHIHACSWWGFLPVMVVGPLNKWFVRKRLMISFHGGGGPVWIERYPWLAVTCLGMADVTVVVSPKIGEAFRKHGVSTEVLWNLVDLDRFHFRERRSVKPNIVWIRQLEDIYGPMAALEVFAKVKREVPEATITFIGDGSLRPEMDSHIRKHQLADVRFTGRLPNQDVPAMFDEADIFLNTSKTDGFPTALLEASASGLPIVTTAAGGIPDMMENGKAGIVVPVGDVDALASEVIGLIRDFDKAHSMSVAARQNAERYGWPRFAGDLAIYYQLDHGGV